MVIISSSIYSSGSSEIIYSPNGTLFKLSTTFLDNTLTFGSSCYGELSSLVTNFLSITPLSGLYTKTSSITT